MITAVIGGDGPGVRPGRESDSQGEDHQMERGGAQLDRGTPSMLLCHRCHSWVQEVRVQTHTEGIKGQADWVSGPSA